MKHALHRHLLLLTSLLLLLSCTQTELPPPDTAVSETETAPAVTDTIPVPNTMPRTDGSTSTLPLDIAVHAAVLGISTDGEHSTSVSVLDGHANPYYFAYFFDVKTGAPLHPDALFTDGWRGDCTVTDTQGNAVNADVLFADGTDLSVLAIADYITAPGHTGTNADNNIPVTLTVCVDGTQYTVTVPRMWIL